MSTVSSLQKDVTGLSGYELLTKEHIIWERTSEVSTAFIWVIFDTGQNCWEPFGTIQNTCGLVLFIQGRSH